MLYHFTYKKKKKGKLHLTQLNSINDFFKSIKERKKLGSTAYYRVSMQEQWIFLKFYVGINILLGRFEDQVRNK